MLGEKTVEERSGNDHVSVLGTIMYSVLDNNDSNTNTKISFSNISHDSIRIASSQGSRQLQIAYIYKYIYILFIYIYIIYTYTYIYVYIIYTYIYIHIQCMYVCIDISSGTPEQ